MTTGFKRARRPEQITARREAILVAAADLFDAEGPEGAGLNAIAARAGFTKSNVYRYFESREAVLIELFLDDFNGFAGAMETDLKSVKPGDLPATAEIIARGFMQRPRLGRLIAILASVLERNVSEASVIDLKTEMLRLVARIAAALSRPLPSLSADDCHWAVAVIGTYVSGLWPEAHPNATVDRVLSRPPFTSLKPSVERDLERMILTLFKGLVADTRL